VLQSKINFIEQTSGVFDIIVPRKSALEAISWLAPRAYGANKNLFLFFENRDGFNFVAYESLLKATPYCTYTFNIKTEQNPVENMNAFNVLNVVQDFDMLKAMRSGAFSSSLLSFDLVSRQFAAFNFSVESLANNAVLNTSLPANDALNRLGQSVFTTTDNMIKFIISTDSDPSVNPANIKKWLPQTASRLGQLNTFKIVGALPGDIQLKAGMVITINMPKGEVQSKTTMNNPYRSGNYLLSSVHHKFILDISSTIVEVLSDTVSSPLASPATTSPSIQQIVAS
jgi:hypothetical protein